MSNLTPIDALVKRWNQQLEDPSLPADYKRGIRDCISGLMGALSGNLYPPTELGMVCHFNKHKGKLWKEVIETAPDYVEWCLANISTFQLDETAHNYLCEVQEQLKMFS